MARGVGGLHGRRSGGDDANGMYFYFWGKANPCRRRGLWASLYD